MTPQDQDEMIRALRKKIVNQKYELRRLSRQLSYYQRGFTWRGYAEHLQELRRNMIAALGETAAMKILSKGRKL